MLKLLLAEDHKLVRAGIRTILDKSPEIQTIAEVGSGQQVIDLLEEIPDIDVLLTDFNMPGMDGLSLIRMAKAVSPNTKIVILSMLDNEQHIAQCFSAGASGYLVKNIDARELIFSLEHVCSQEKYLCSELAIKMFEKVVQKSVLSAAEAFNNEFSNREIEVLQLIAEGMTNQEMSDKLFLSKRTVEGHRQSLIDKTQSKNTAALIRSAVLSGLIQ